MRDSVFHIWSNVLQEKEKIRLGDLANAIRNNSLGDDDFIQNHLNWVRENIPLDGMSYKIKEFFQNSISNIPRLENDTEPSCESSSNHPKVASVADLDMVPLVDPTYVPWGAYDALSTVFSKNVFLPVLITGDTGNGKTMAVEQAAANTSRKLVIFNTTVETTEEDLVGHYVLTNGDTVWQDGPAIVAMKEGAILCLDEIDQATTRIMCLQTILQGKPYFNKKTNEIVRPKNGFTVVATANTKGRGDSSDRFIGAQVMNEAFLERFPVTVEQFYPSPAVEKKILLKHLKNKELINFLVEWAKQTRSAFSEGIFENCITTRRLVQVCQNYSVFGDIKIAIEYAINRFSDEMKEPFMNYWNKLYVPPAPNTNLIVDPLSALDDGKIEF